MKTYKNVNELPSGTASKAVTPGCLVLEGGAFRGVYTNGVIDALMLAGINLECTVGVSAGALNGMNYVSGQIGRSGRINLLYRHDSRYVGRKALVRNKGIIGFDFMFNELPNILPFDEKRFFSPERRFVAVATNCLTGRPEYFEAGKCSDIYAASRASASMPVVSKMVYIDGRPYLDGGCSVKIPIDWALAEGYGKIVLVRSRERAFRRPPESSRSQLLKRRVYKKYPEFLSGLLQESERYNALVNHIDQLEKSGRIFVIAPSKPITVSRLEGDMDKLGALYHLGFEDTRRALPALNKYLEKQLNVR